MLQLEPAFWVSFLRYTEWPPERFGATDAPCRVAVVGTAGAAQAVRDVARAAGGFDAHRIEVIHSPPNRDKDPPAVNRDELQRLHDSHLVFLHRVPGSTRAQVLQALAGAPVPTVGGTPGFTRQGGMLGLVPAGARLAFEANPDVIESCHLVVSAKVLKLAQISRGSAP